MKFTPYVKDHESSRHMLFYNKNGMAYELLQNDSMYKTMYRSACQNDIFHCKSNTIPYIMLFSRGENLANLLKIKCS